MTEQQQQPWCNTTWSTYGKDFWILKDIPDYLEA